MDIEGPAKVHTPVRRKRFSVNAVFDNFFVLLGALSAVWLAWLVLQENLLTSWWALASLIFWILVAYLILPRAHRILTQLYVPGYFIGRARTSDGLLGDPINLAVRGSEQQLDAAMRRAGWTPADPITLRSTWRIITATIFRRSYDEAPVSPLLLFDRQQDVAYQQEVRGNPAKRHHVRFWRCPEGWLLPGGHGADFLAAGTFDRAVGFSLFTLQITHKIDENTDIERDHIVDTVSGADDAVGVRVIRDFSSGYHSRNGGGDAIRTDGDLPILDLRSVSVPEGTGTPFADAAVIARERRPMPTIVGSLLMGLRVIAALIYVGFMLVNSSALIDSTQLDITGLTRTQLESFTELSFYVVVGGLTAGVLFYFLLAVLVYRGSNWARIAAMGISGLAIVNSAVSFFSGDAPVRLQANLIGLPLDILVLFALSSESARFWARRNERRDRARKRIAHRTAARARA
jgi:hypothetical protein